MDIQTKSYRLWKAKPTETVGEVVFAPKSPSAPEGQGYILATVWHADQNLRSDLVILDAERVEEGPIARVLLPVQAAPQVHGWWVREDQYPAQPA